LENRGDRLVFSWGIVTLAGISSIIVIAFDANEIAMLPLYALGVMLSFTLSQAGMSRLMGKVGTLQPGETLRTIATQIHYEPNWHWKRAVNTVGAVTTGVVFVVLLATKFLDGAWIIALAIPGMVFTFHRIHRHYEQVAAALSTEHFHEDDLAEIANVVIVPIADVHRGTLRALQYAKRISNDVRAVSVATRPEIRQRVEQRWSRFPKLTEGIKLIIIDYDYRDILHPLVDYIERVNDEEFADQVITIVIPEFVSADNMSYFLHNQTANFLRRRLRAKQDIVVIDVPYHIVTSGLPDDD
jgi:hypothetical protein